MDLAASEATPGLTAKLAPLAVLLVAAAAGLAGLAASDLVSRHPGFLLVIMVGGGLVLTQGLVVGRLRTVGLGLLLIEIAAVPRLTSGPRTTRDETGTVER